MYAENDISTWTEAHYDQALAEIESLMHFAPGTPQNARLVVLGALVEQYEDRHWHIPAPSAEAQERYAHGADGQKIAKRLVSV
jgi:antitoxin component HigA of HigAB toxin-antitoxin module